jgi:AraC family transcriptional regulator of adaptative response / DNA-3-methyladenine glycosylase II
VRTVLGQQVSTLAARTLHARLVERFGDEVETPVAEIDRLHPTAARLAAARVEDLAAIGLPKARAATIRAIAIAVTDGTLRLDAGADPDEAEATLLALPGVGPWTAQYVMMRALGVPDAFPDGDLALLRALPAVSRKALVARAEAWRPWRAYAAILLWSSLHGE